MCLGLGAVKSSTGTGADVDGADSSSGADWDAGAAGVAGGDGDCAAGGVTGGGSGGCAVADDAHSSRVTIWGREKRWGAWGDGVGWNFMRQSVSLSPAF